MSELIRREDAIEAVADYFDKLKVARRYAKSVLNHVPSVDAVEVVRCRDCEYYIPSNRRIRCGFLSGYVEDDDYCSYGERNTND